jgi:hypothetical protein
VDQRLGVNVLDPACNLGKESQSEGEIDGGGFIFCVALSSPLRKELELGWWCDGIESCHLLTCSGEDRKSRRVFCVQYAICM